MNIVVCLKQVLDPALVEFDIATSELRAPRWRLDQLDCVALEQALRCKSASGAAVTVITAGPARTEEILRHGLTSGADRAIRVGGDAVEDADAWVTAGILAAAVRRLEPDLVLCGARSSDSGGECLGAYLAAALDVAFIGRVVWLEPRGAAIAAHSREESGWREELHAALPVVAAVETALNEPRYVPMLSRVYREGARRSIETWDVDELDVEAEALVPRVVALDLTQPKPRTKVGVKVTGLSMADKLKLMRGGRGGGQQRELLKGDPAESASRIVAKLDEWLA